MTKIKVVDLEKLWNFIVYNFLFEIIYCFKMLFEIQFEIVEEHLFLFLISGQNL